jgi:hypothetical protein
MFNLEDYTTVKERIKLFWEKYPDGSIQTEILDWSDKRFIVKASLYRLWTDEKPFATGHAHELVGERGVNRDFALENGETSSIGIAMKNANIGTDKNAPSREEMEKVQRVKADKIHVENPSDPWTIKTVETPKPAVDAALDLLTQELGAQVVEEAPSCKHGVMQLLEGTSSKTGKPYKGYKCKANIQPNGAGLCDTIWYELAPNGSWRPQKPKGK